MSLSKDELIKIFYKDSNIKTSEDTQNVLLDLFVWLLQPMIKGEMGEQLGYAKNNYQNKNHKLKKINNVV